MKQRGGSDFLNNLKKIFVVEPWSKTSGRTGYTPPKKTPTPEGEFVLVDDKEFDRKNPGMTVVVVTPDKVSKQITVKELAEKAKQHNKSVVFATGSSARKLTPPLPVDQEALFFGSEARGRKMTRTGRTRTGKRRRGTRRMGKRRTGRRRMGKRRTRRKSHRSRTHHRKRL